jgi:hypothetical protein
VQIANRRGIRSINNRVGQLCSSEKGKSRSDFRLGRHVSCRSIHVRCVDVEQICSIPIPSLSLSKSRKYTRSDGLFRRVQAAHAFSDKIAPSQKIKEAAARRAPEESEVLARAPARLQATWLPAPWQSRLV